jgi:hypothetical protein
MSLSTFIHFTIHRWPKIGSYDPIETNPIGNRPIGADFSSYRELTYRKPSYRDRFWATDVL